MIERLPDSFHPLIRDWFARRYGEPTPVQALAWPPIAAGEHVLAVAPTGSGKTLTAFLDALSRFASGGLPAEGLSVLYVSPLKALNEDIRRNLLAPLAELRAHFLASGSRFPHLRVATRSGDTPQNERRRMLSDPPNILCTTPESLMILLCSRGGQALLSSTRLVILDELHAALGTKRGSLQACSLGRLALLAGEFQRVALSATVNPLRTAAAYVGARRLVREPGAPARHEPRSVRIVEAPGSREYRLEVAWPPAVVLPSPSGTRPQAGDETSSRYAAVVRDLVSRLGPGRTALAFADSRRRTERVAAMINEAAGEGTAWAHHGSLSRDVRRAVEERLKEGRLPCVVATGSLELGIDIGAVDLVAMLGPASRADQALQRLGRAGHAVGETSRGVVYPFHGMDLLKAAAMADAVAARAVDPVEPPRAPLDVLAQTLLAMTLFEERKADELYDEVLSFAPFDGLSREDFDAVLGMLAGRYETARVSELKARVWLDPGTGLARAREGAAMLLYSSGGAIPDRGYYAMRAPGGAKIGELDEEFVFERRVGNSFAFGAQAWRITAISDEAVEVVPLGRDADFMPFWKAEKAPRGPSLSAAMLALCDGYRMDPAAFEDSLRRSRGFSAEAAAALRAFLDRQARAQAGIELPGESSVSVELCRGDSAGGPAPGPGSGAAAGSGAVIAILHTLRGLAVNEALGAALSAELERGTGAAVDAVTDDDGILLVLPLRDADEARRALDEAIAALGDPDRLAALIRGRLEGTAAFGAAFRENAGRALLLPRGGFGKRSPLWVTRRRAKALYERVRAYADFPIIRESWRSILEQRYDLAGLARLCAGLASGEIRHGYFGTMAPSPFASQAAWAETNRYLYEGDELGAGRSAFSGEGGAPSAGDMALRGALGEPALRPRIPAGVAAAFRARRRRELPSWAPESEDALADWVDERVLIPVDDWERLLDFCPPALAAAAREALPGAGSVPAVASARASGPLSRLALARLPGAGVDLVVTRSRLADLEDDPSSALAGWLRSEGPVPLSRLQALFGLSPEAAGTMVEDLVEDGSFLHDGDGFRIEGEEGRPSVCAADALEALLRSARRAARPSLEARPLEALPGFLALVQGLPTEGPEAPRVAPGAAQGGAAGARAGGLEAALDALAGYPAHESLWETELLPARVRGYDPGELDALLASGEFLWFGAGRETLSFCRSAELGLFGGERGSALFGPGSPPLDAWALRDRSGLPVSELAPALWAEVWKGSVSSLSFEAVRAAIASGRKPAAPVPRAEARAVRGGPARIPLALRDRWKQGAPVAGLWYPLELERVDSDELDEADLLADRARALARRYGLLARELLEREAPRLSWALVFPALRRLELSGELVCGRFFEGLDGAQFMSREAFALFREGASARGVWSLNACDPACLIPPGLPVARRRDARLAFLDGAAAFASSRSMASLSPLMPPEHPALAAVLGSLAGARVPLKDSRRRLVVETVGDLPAAESPYAPALREIGFEPDRGRMVRW